MVTEYDLSGYVTNDSQLSLSITGTIVVRTAASAICLFVAALLARRDEERRNKTEPERCWKGTREQVLKITAIMTSWRIYYDVDEQDNENL